MITQVLWWAGIALIVLLLFRGVSEKLLARYPFFYGYQVFFILRSLLCFYFYVARPETYQRFYWYSEFLSVAVEYLVIWEIYAQTLAGYAGAARMARRLLSLVFVVVMAKALITAVSGSVWLRADATAEVEVYLRSVQAFLLLGVLAVLAYYEIPIRRNLRGMILGYCLFVGTRVISLALRMKLGEEFQLWWQYLQQTAYCVTAAIWVMGLWSYAPQSEPEQGSALERDYDHLVTEASRAVARARIYLMRAVRL